MGILYQRTNELIALNGGNDDDIHEYYDGALLSISDDYNFCFYSKVMELPGFRELLKKRKIRIAFKETCDYAPGIKGDFIVLRPFGKIMRGAASRDPMSFDNTFHYADMFVIRPRKLRETIAVCGIQPSMEYRLRTRHGFETEEPRIYVIIPDRVRNIFECTVDDMNDAIRWAVNDYHSRYGEIEYDVWSAKIPWKSDIRKDAAFEYGGYVVDAISPENLTLVNTIRRGEEHQNENIAMWRNKWESISAE